MEEVIFLDTMNLIVAANIRRLREERNLSMEELARLSGVSKSMLAQVERGDGNPTLSTLWKLSNGMKVPFDALTVRPKAPYEIIKASEIQPLLEDSGRVRNYPIFPDDENRRFAVYYWSWSREATGSRSPTCGEPLNLSPSSAGRWRSSPQSKVFPYPGGRASGLRATPSIPTGIREKRLPFCI